MRPWTRVRDKREKRDAGIVVDASDLDLWYPPHAGYVAVRWDDDPLVVWCVRLDFIEPLVKP